MLHSAPAFAQANLPSTADPSRVQERLEPPIAPDPSRGPVVEPLIESQDAPPNAEQVRFVLTQLTVEGSSVYSEADLRPFYEAQLGQTVSVAQLYAIAQAITDRYAADGYILAQALVPPQKINGKGARIQVVEGYVERVTFEGDVPGDLAARIASRITASRPLKGADLERAMLLLDDLPGIKARSLLRPSPTTQGAAELVVMVERARTDGYVSIDNRGSRYVGPLQLQAGVFANSLAGWGERIGLRTLASSTLAELRYGEFSWDHPLDADGSRAVMSVWRADSQPGYRLDNQGITSHSTGLGIAASHPFLRSRASNLTGRARLEAKDSVTEQNSTELSEDRIRALRIGGSYDQIDTLWKPAVNMLTVELSQGLPFAGARESGAAHASRDDGKAGFTKLTAEAQRLQSLGGNVSLLAGVSGQISRTALLSAEEFALGGSSYARAFDAAEVTGDHGLAAKLELQYGGDAERQYLAGYQFYAFADHGVVWNENQNSGATAKLASVGIGARLNFTEELSGSVELAQPVVGRVAAFAPDGGKSPRLFFSLVGRF